MKNLNKSELVERAMYNDKLKKKLGYVCVYCGCTNRLILTIDHKTPLARGGKDEDSNKQVCCYICNQLKGALKHDEFKKYLKNLYELKALQKIYLKSNEIKPRLVFTPDYYPGWVPKKRKS